MTKSQGSGSPSKRSGPLRRRSEPAGPFTVAGVEVPPGERRLIDLHAPRHFTHSDVVVPVHVVHGAWTGPVLFVCAAIHGDEINGVDVIRRLLKRRLLRELRGTLLAVPVVNVHGFMAHSRYLPDRRDLNRCFPGMPKGSLTARVAHLFTQEVVRRATHGIDLHTGAIHRANLPQVRGDLDDPETLRLARAFGVPVVIHALGPPGTLHDATRPRGIPLLVYEGGEALRFDEVAAQAALKGIFRVMRALDMLPPRKAPRHPPLEPLVTRARRWVRAPESGVLLSDVALGDTVKRGQVLATITDPFGQSERAVKAPAAGVVIGRVQIPLVNEGDALFHLALTGATRKAAAALTRFEQSLGEPSGEILADDLFAAQSAEGEDAP